MADPGEDDEAMRQVGDAVVVRAVFDDLPVMTAALDGPDGRVVAANAGWRALFGVSDVIGTPLRDVAPELFDAVREVYASGEPRSLPEWRGPRGIVVDCELTPRRDADGAVCGVTTHLTEVTELVRERRDASRRAAEAQRHVDEARDVISAVQRRLLPTGLPVLPGVWLSAGYLLAESQFAAGGDWFDAVALPGRVALVVGDVVGHGIAAAATMGQLRAVLRDRLGSDGDIAGALHAVDRLAADLAGAHAATVCVVVLDLADGTLAYCTAGHPPPLVASTTGATRYLAPSGSGPLGVGARFVVAHDRLADDELILVYSDGIIERPGREPAASTVELAHAVGAAAAGGDGAADSVADTMARVCVEPLETLVRSTGHTDDIMLLAARRAAPLPPLRLELPAEPPTIRRTRDAVAAWLDDLGVDDDTMGSVSHALGELVTNAVQHAYVDVPEPGSIRVTAVHTDDGFAEITVADDGRWREHDHAGSRSVRGATMGLTMAAAFSGDLRVRRDAGRLGTTAVVRSRLSRSALLPMGGDEPSEPSGDSPLLLVLDQPHPGGPRVRVDGPIDSLTARELATELLRRTSGGTAPLFVDLTGVTHLASAGVSILHEAVARNAANEAPLQLYAPAGGVAGHVLTIAALPHHTTDPD